MFPYPFSFLTQADTGLAQIDNDFSMDFDGVDQAVNLGSMTNIVDNKSKLSISAWVYTTNLGINRGVTGKYAGTANWIAVTVLTTGNVLMAISNASYRYTYSAASLVTLNNWHHIVCVFDGTQVVNLDRIKIYVDGVESGSYTTNPLIPATTAPSVNFGTGSYVDKFWIGSSGYSTGGYDPPEDGFVGKIDEVAYWNVALDLSEIQDIYNATSAGKTADLSEMDNPPAAWYRMGD